MHKRLASLKKTVLCYYRRAGRSLPWRRTADPYKILVSEIMLQQTQVSRVMLKYGPFLKKFPNFSSLAAAPIYDVLSEWQGLGYNRRAVALKRAAEMVVEKYKGILPKNGEELLRLPGIGPATAAAIMAFAFNKATPCIETNIRTVFIHTFFRMRKKVADKELLPLIAATLDRKNPRAWYYALMDYGVMLKKKYRNPSRMSAHYKTQSKFEGSHRQLRGRVLRQLLAGTIKKPRKSAQKVLQEFKREGLLPTEKGML